MFATIYVPNFYLQAALRHEPALRAKPVALIDEQTAKATIIEMNEAAEIAGVCCGMPPSQGLARCLSLTIKTRDRRQEEVLAMAMLQLAFTLSPDVEETGAGIWTVQFTDTHELEGKVARVISAMREMDVSGRAGIALTADASFLAAHVAQAVVQIDNAASFLASLPIETLAV